MLIFISLLQGVTSLSCLCWILLVFCLLTAFLRSFSQQIGNKQTQKRSKPTKNMQNTDFNNCKIPCFLCNNCIAMGCFDVMCIICGNTCHAPLPEYENQVEITGEFRRKTNWLNKCTFLTKLNKVIHGCKEVACNNTFSKNGMQYEHNWYNDFDQNEGIFIHDDCWKYVKQKIGMALTYGDLPLFDADITEPIATPTINYGKIADYWQQDFQFEQAIIDKNEWMCESPLKNTKNATRINHIINQLKIRNDVSRKSPSASATFFPERTIKIGNDGNFWIIKGGKWVKMNGTKTTETIEIARTQQTQANKGWKTLEKTQQIGTYSNLPMFITNIVEKGNKTIFTIISLNMDANK